MPQRCLDTRPDIKKAATSCRLPWYVSCHTLSSTCESGWYLPDARARLSHHRVPPCGRLSDKRATPCLSIFFSLLLISCINTKKRWASQSIACVGVRRLELPTSTSRTWRANQLCYTPNQKFGCKDSAFFSTAQHFRHFFDCFCRHRLHAANLILSLQSDNHYLWKPYYWH